MKICGATLVPVSSAENLIFSFGSNWSNFLKTINEDRINAAAQNLTFALGDISGKSFLDVGCGSGLHSLAALRLGASRVHSFDSDPESVECTKRLRSALSATDKWSIERGSALDSEYLQSLGKFDIVYAWGVLHHTGQMWKALDVVTIPVADRLFVSIYNAQGFWSLSWRAVKSTHAHGSRRVKKAIEVGVFAFQWGKHAVANCLRFRPLATFKNWKQYYKNRGMSPWHDVVDWAGGYPFEVAKPIEVISFYEARGFRACCIRSCGRGHGCNEFLIQRPSAQ